MLKKHILFGCGVILIVLAACASQKDATGQVVSLSTSCTDSDYSGSPPKYGTFDSQKFGKANAVTAGTNIKWEDFCADDNLEPTSVVTGTRLLEYRCNKFQLLERFVVACTCSNGKCIYNRKPK